MERKTYQPVPPDAFELPTGIELDLLLTEMRQAFVADARLGVPIVNPRRIALNLIADGHGPEIARWLIREGKIAACVHAIHA